MTKDEIKAAITNLVGKRRGIKRNDIYTKMGDKVSPVDVVPVLDEMLSSGILVNVDKNGKEVIVLASSVKKEDRTAQQWKEDVALIGDMVKEDKDTILNNAISSFYSDVLKDKKAWEKDLCMVMEMNVHESADVLINRAVREYMRLKFKDMAKK